MVANYIIKVIDSFDYNMFDEYISDGESSPLTPDAKEYYNTLNDGNGKFLVKIANENNIEIASGTCNFNEWKAKPNTILVTENQNIAQLEQENLNKILVKFIFNSLDNLNYKFYHDQNDTDYIEFEVPQDWLN